MFHYHQFIVSREKQGEDSFLNFPPKSLHMTSESSKGFFFYFHNVDSLKFSETSFARSMAPADGVLNFYLLEATQDPVDAFEIYDVVVLCAGISRSRPHLHFLFTRFLAHRASCRGKSGIFGIVKLYFINMRKNSCAL